ncbi:hypothetical protein E9529_01085 [Blastococcus sp. KM273128]|uniref:hypothetical protein n=1 Tax=Blastococcus sp. KM273128 TaxID=2570314 RepID=UPI001F392318|nr:hypothetical protein [Blastococcus sp. KM273128]MCF6742883.1 hypothetical protein [Blastococcus sp. KM273128]
MSQEPADRPRPTARPRPAPAARPTPRPRVAGSRREREDGPVSAHGSPVAAPEAPAGPATRRAASPRRHAAAPRANPVPRRRRPGRAPVAVLAVLCLLAAVGTGVLLRERLDPRYVQTGVIEAAGDGVRALYAYDYQDSQGSVEGKLAVLTGELREQYERDLSQGGIIDTYEQVSATTSYEVGDVGLQQINEAQDTATLVVFGQYVVRSVNTGGQQPPEGSECQVTPEGAQSCVQTVQVRMVTVDGGWKISELTLLTTS